MTTSESKLSQTLAAQNVTSAEQVQSLFAELRARFDSELAAATSPTLFKSFRDTWLARKSGVITLVTDHWLRPATPELKRAVGALLNELRKHVDSEIAGRQASLESRAGTEAGVRDRIDLSLPGVVRPLGTHHLIRQVMQEIEDIFFSIGFSVVEGPEIETPYYNFEALNIPEYHPVRDDMDTFYLELPKGHPGPVAASHPHFARADSRHGNASAARAHHCSRQGLSPRQSRRHAFVHVSPDRRLGRRHGHHFLRFHGHNRLFHKASFSVESVKSASGPAIFRLRSLAWNSTFPAFFAAAAEKQNPATLAGNAKVPAGSSCLAPAWWIPLFTDS